MLYDVSRNDKFGYIFRGNWVIPPKFITKMTTVTSWLKPNGKRRSRHVITTGLTTGHNATRNAP